MKPGLHCRPCGFCVSPTGRHIPHMRGYPAHRGLSASLLSMIQFRVLATHCAEVCMNLVPPPTTREQGMPGACCTRGLVCNVGRSAHTSIQVQPEHSGIPCAMG